MGGRGWRGDGNKDGDRNRDRDKDRDRERDRDRDRGRPTAWQHFAGTQLYASWTGSLLPNQSSEVLLKNK